MTSEITKTQTARLLACFIRYADEKGAIDPENQEFIQGIGNLFSNGNVLDAHLHELNTAGIVHYEEIGEDGFKPIVMAGCTKKTTEYLSTLLEEIDDDLGNLKRRISEILTFDPDRLKIEIASAEAQLMAARKSAEGNELLKPLLQPIKDIETHFLGVAAVASKYEDVYKNIIRPVQLEGQSGVKATVRWAIIGIIGSTLLSAVLSNWKDLSGILKGFF